MLLSSVKGTGVFGAWLDDMLPKALSFFWSVVIALVAWYVGAKIIKYIRKLIARAFEKKGTETGVRQFTDAVVKTGLYIVLIIVILNIFGIQTSSIAAAVASLGVTVGLALQGSLSNFAGGVLILVLHPFTVGDYIVEDTHGNEGTVQEISIFYTKLLTYDGLTVVIPNGTLANSSLTNYSASHARRVFLEVGISYDADLGKAKEVLTGVIRREEKRLTDHPADVITETLGDSAVTLAVRFWTRDSDYWEVRYRTVENMKLALDAAGISIPYPQVDVHVREQKEGISR